MPDRYILLDRDGTIIVEKNYLSDPEQVELLPGVGEALAKAHQWGWGLALVTNQSGIGRGYFSESDLEAIHERMNFLLEREGASLDGIYVCPHVPDEECGCRKPSPGLIERAAAELKFDPAQAIVVGDKICDLDLGRRVGARVCLVRSGYGAETEKLHASSADYVIDHLGQLPGVLLKETIRMSQAIESPPLQDPTADGVEDWVRTHLHQSATVKHAVAEQCMAEIVHAVNMMTRCLRSGQKILLCGNGGSAADSQHIAAEFISLLSTEFDRPGLPAIALTTDTSVMTARGNDFGFEEVFSRQVEALGKEGDVLVLITTSGNSDNLIRAYEAAKLKGIETIGLLGKDGGVLSGRVDCPIVVPSRITQHIQESHIAIGHILVALTERRVMAP